ncbi:MAG: hypothetical protein O2992_09660 [Gemmatimonadetes bacterium]|nr:hypothetical protein [Gemmatimonadota bacterium]
MKTKAQKQREEWERVYGSPERCEWTAFSPSVVSGKGPCVCAHVTPDEGLPSGTGRKADHSWIVPLTWDEHNELHQWGEKTFQAHYGVSLAGKAREHHRKWLALQDHNGGEESASKETAPDYY